MWFIPRVGVQVKLWNPSTTRASASVFRFFTEGRHDHVYLPQWQTIDRQCRQTNRGRQRVIQLNLQFTHRTNQSAGNFTFSTNTGIMFKNFALQDTNAVSGTWICSQQSHIITFFTKILYIVLLVDCLRLFRNFNAWKARMCTKFICPTWLSQACNLYLLIFTENWKGNGNKTNAWEANHPSSRPR